MTHAITKRSKLIASAGAFMLTLLLLLSPVGRSSLAGTFSWLVGAGDAVTELPCRIVTGFRNFSLDRLDPTCPQCI